MTFTKSVIKSKFDISSAPATQKAAEKSAAFFVLTFGSNATNMFTVYVLLSEKFNKKG